MSKNIASLIGRKWRTFAAVIRNCQNWPRVLFARIGIGRGPALLVHRNGVVIEPSSPIRNSWGELFEPLLADVYEISTIDKVDMVLDVGANVGSFSSLAGRSHPDTRIIAFEPSSAIIGLLKRNLERNGITNATIVPQPLGATEREVIFYDSDGGGSSSCYIHTGEARTMKTATLDGTDFTAITHLFIKLDCEGSEGEVIRWITENVQRLPPRINIACEYHHWCPVPLEESIKKLEAAGFTTEQKTKFDEPYLFAKKE